MRILTEHGYSFATIAKREIECYVKAKLVYIALDFNIETREAGESSDKERTYELPNGSEPTLSASPVLCTSFAYFPNSLVCGLTDQSHSERLHIELAVLAILALCGPLRHCGPRGSV